MARSAKYSQYAPSTRPPNRDARAGTLLISRVRWNASQNARKREAKSEQRIALTSSRDP